MRCVYVRYSILHLPIYTVMKVPNAAYIIIVPNNCGCIEYNIRLNDTKSMIDVANVINNCKLNAVNVRTSSVIR